MAETLAEALTQVIVLHKLPQRIALADRGTAGPLVPDRYLPPLPVKAAGGYPARAECRRKSPPSPDTGWHPPPATRYSTRWFCRRSPHGIRSATVRLLCPTKPASGRTSPAGSGDRVHVRRQQRHRGRHQIDHPGQRAFEQRRVFPIAVHQHVFPLLFSC